MILFLILGLIAIVAIVDWGLTWLIWSHSSTDCLPIRSTVMNLFLPDRVLGIAGVAVTHLVSAARLNLPFAKVVDVASREESGEAKAVLERLSYGLSHGSLPSVALRHSIRGCPAFVSATVQAGEDAGQIAAALELAHARIRQRRNHARLWLSPGLMYPCVLFLFWVAIMTGTLVTVIPKFAEIFIDFDTPLPASTIAMINLGKSASALATPLFILAIAAVPIGLIVPGLSLRPRRPATPRVLASLGDSLRWLLPVLRSLDRGNGYADVLGAIRLGLRGGLPLERAVELACDVDVNDQVRNHFLDFCRHLKVGMAPGEAATDARLGPVVASAFNSVMRGTPPDVALGFAADYHRAVATRQWHNLVRLITPLVTLAAGGITAFTVFALFEPLVALIDSVMRPMGG